MNARRDLSSPPPPRSRRFQVLSLSGGGVRGLYSACVLEELEQRAGKPLHQCFDLLAGTSIGGIIALGLALGRSAAEVRLIIEEAAPRLFGDSPWRRLRSLFRARYDDGPLRETIEAVVGANATLGDLETPLVVPAVALTAGAAQLFRSPHHGAHARQSNARLVDVAMATAAAPSLFPVARVGDAEYVDGGLIAHCPDAVALHEAEVYFARRRDDVFMLSVGTTQELAALPAGGDRSRGLLWWMRGARLPATIAAAQQGLSWQVAGESLGERHVVINTPRSRHQAEVVAIDRAGPEAIRTLKVMARHTLESREADPRLMRMLAHTSDTPPALA